MKTIQVVEGAEEGDLSNWAVMAALPRLKRPRSTYVRLRTFSIQQEEEEEEEGGGGGGDQPATSCSQSSLSEDDEAPSMMTNLSEVGITAQGASPTGCLSDRRSSSSSHCETPKGRHFEIPEPNSPPSPPRKKSAISAHIRVRPRATAAFFHPPHDFERLFAPLASVL